MNLITGTFVESVSQQAAGSAQRAQSFSHCLEEFRFRILLCLRTALKGEEME